MIFAAPGGGLQFVRCVSVSDDSGRGGRFIFSCSEGEKRDIVSPTGVGELSETKDTFTFKQATSALPGIRQDCGEAACVDPVTATQHAAAGDEGGCCVMSVKLNELCGFSCIVGHGHVRAIAAALRRSLVVPSSCQCLKTELDESFLKISHKNIFPKSKFA